MSKRKFIDEFCQQVKHSRWLHLWSSILHPKLGLRRQIFYLKGVLDFKRYFASTSKKKKEDILCQNVLKHILC